MVVTNYHVIRAVRAGVFTEGLSKDCTHHNRHGRDERGTGRWTDGTASRTLCHVPFHHPFWRVETDLGAAIRKNQGDFPSDLASCVPMLEFDTPAVMRQFAHTRTSHKRRTITGLLSNAWWRGAGCRSSHSTLLTLLRPKVVINFAASTHTRAHTHCHSHTHTHSHSHSHSLIHTHMVCCTAQPRRRESGYLTVLSAGAGILGLLVQERAARGWQRAHGA